MGCKIAIASCYLGQIARGVETWARDLGAELHRRGEDVTLFKGGGPAEFPYEQRIACADHRRSIWRNLTRLTTRGGWRFGLHDSMTLQQVTFGWCLAQKLRAGQFDIVHLQDPWTARVLERTLKMSIHRTRVIIAHGTDESFDFISRLAHVQEIASYYLEQDRRAELPADRRWFAIPNFVNCKRFIPGDRLEARRQLGLPVNRTIIFESAALKLTHKRLDYLIREVAHAKQSCAELFLVIAGATDGETAVVERLAETQLGPHVRLLKSVPHDQMPLLYQAADIFAHPALREPLGIVFLEAMATGLPCLGHTFPVTQWVIGPGGRTVDMTAPGSLSAALIELGKDPARREQIGRAAREYAQKTFETVSVVDQMLTMYRTVLETSQ